jgi:hypothetical protein
MKQTLQKLTSRKFLLSVISMLAGIAALCGADETIVAIIAGAAMTVLPALVYCITEGRIDTASVLAAKQAVTDAAEALGANEATQAVIDAAGDMLAAISEEDRK